MAISPCGQFNTLIRLIISFCFENGVVTDFGCVDPSHDWGKSRNHFNVVNLFEFGAANHLVGGDPSEMIPLAEKFVYESVNSCM